jgi:hypothetical protein
MTWLGNKTDVTSDFWETVVACLTDDAGKCCEREIVIDGEPKYTVSLRPYKKPEGDES